MSAFRRIPPGRGGRGGENLRHNGHGGISRGVPYGSRQSVYSRAFAPVARRAFPRPWPHGGRHGRGPSAPLHDGLSNMTEGRFPVRRQFLRIAVSSMRRVVAAAPNGCGHGRAAWGSVSAGTICRAAAMRRSARRVSVGAPAFSDSCVCVIAAHQICDPASYRRFNRGILP